MECSFCTVPEKIEMRQRTVSRSGFFADIFIFCHSL